MTVFEDLWKARFGTDPAPLPSEMEAQAALSGILGRRSCRDFQDHQIPEEVLNLVLACAQSAPAKSDLQQYSIMVVDDPALRNRMAEWSSHTKWMGQAPCFLIFCGDLNRQRQISAHHGMEHRNDNIDTFMNTAVDAALALGFCVIAAEAAGLGCCPISVVRNHIEDLVALLELPNGVYPVAGLALGYPSRSADTSLRLPPQMVVHRNRYGVQAFSDQLDAYDERRHQLAPITSDKQRHPAIFGIKDKITWSENTARQMSQPERASFSEFLKSHGFLLT